MNLQTPIPKQGGMTLGKIHSSECNDKLVDFYEYSKGCDRIARTKPAYYEKRLPGSIDKCFMRSRVADLLIKAADNLPQGLSFKIYDAWRPSSVQEYLFHNYVEQLSRLPKNKGKSLEQLHEEAAEFVSFPSKDPTTPFVHATGGAVDLTIVDENHRELAMGTEFDDFTEKAHTAYYENSSHSGDLLEQIRSNRRLLYNIMTGVGFTNLPSEWWHYDYGDRFWAYFNNTAAIYEGILTIEEVIAFDL
jgi:D-alanyl-D-alanine dipeptidase